MNRSCIFLKGSFSRQPYWGIWDATWGSKKKEEGVCGGIVSSVEHDTWVRCGHTPAHFPRIIVQTACMYFTSCCKSSKYFIIGWFHDCSFPLFSWSLHALAIERRRYTRCVLCADMCVWARPVTCIQLDACVCACVSLTRYHLLGTLLTRCDLC